MQVLAALLCGSGQQALLSSPALDSVLSQLQQQLQNAQGAESQATKPALRMLGTLRVLQAATFAPAVLLQPSSSEHSLRQQAASAMAACFACSLQSQVSMQWTGTQRCASFLPQLCCSSQSALYSC